MCCKRNETVILTSVVAMLFAASSIRCGSRHRPSHPTCKRPELLHVVDLRVQDVTSVALDPVRMDAQSLKRTAKEVLQLADGLLFVPNGRTGCRPRYRLTIGVEFSRLGLDRKSRATVLIALALHRMGDKNSTNDLLYRATAEKVYAPSRTMPRKAVYADLFRNGLRDILRYPIAQHKLVRAPAHILSQAIETGCLHEAEARLHRAVLPVGRLMAALAGLTAPPLATGIPAFRTLSRFVSAPLNPFEHDVRDMAIQAAGRRKMDATVPSLIDVVRSSNSRRSRNLSIGALVSIGDERAVPALTADADFSDPDRLREIIEALSQIGGDEARQFLELTADGNPDPEIKTMARSSLKHLEERAQSPR
ncbi:MAG: HEAT repeat domain-containing protein [Deltaproteobacteria bacterium]|nr:HEAT repeat domain-containing protein [Deltaproteobacteria bacterium]